MDHLEGTKSLSSAEEWTISEDFKANYKKDYDDSKTYEYTTFIRQAWKEEPEPHADGTPQASCSLRLNIEYAKARKEFLKAETVDVIIEDAARTAATDAVNCARSLVESAAILPDLIDKFKLDSVTYELYASQSDLDAALNQALGMEFAPQVAGATTNSANLQEALCGDASAAGGLRISS